MSTKITSFHLIAISVTSCRIRFLFNSRWTTATLKPLVPAFFRASVSSSPRASWFTTGSSTAYRLFRSVSRSISKHLTSGSASLKLRSSGTSPAERKSHARRPPRISANFRDIQTSRKVHLSSQGSTIPTRPGPIRADPRTSVGSRRENRCFRCEESWRVISQHLPSFLLHSLTQARARAPAWAQKR